jgi:hypothetical protein
MALTCRERLMRVREQPMIMIPRATRCIGLRGRCGKGDRELVAWAVLEGATL